MESPRGNKRFVQQLGGSKKIDAGELFEEWQPGITYPPQAIVRHGKKENGKTRLFQVMQGHSSQPDWLPENVPALYKEIGFTEGGVPVWVQPQGGHDSYKKNAEVSHREQIWVSTIPNNVWEPGVYGWELKPDENEIPEPPKPPKRPNPPKVEIPQPGGPDPEEPEPPAEPEEPPVEPDPPAEPEEPAASAWVQPTGGHDAYSVGDVVSHNGKTWESTANGNVWEPGVYGWSVIS